jgi:cob(I)alamin adenosyltransferase
VITGPGKGKTTSAFGVAMRAAGHGLKVCIVQFLKTGGSTGEVVSSRRILEINVKQFGTGKFVDPNNLSEDDKKRAKDALEYAKSVIAKGGCGVLILDEVNVAVSFGLVDPKEVINMLRSRGEGMEVVLTGRNAPREFIEHADYVSVIESVKHPFDKGAKPRKGVEW